MKKTLTIGLIGNPNSGKTTLFNALTGSRQYVGNWSGVTVDRKSGYFEHDEHLIQIVDLPGIYSLSIPSESGSLDERIAVEYILSNQANLIVNVINANNLERNLYLTTQLLELQIPVILAVNMSDIAKKHGSIIDLEQLSQTLGIPTVALVSTKKTGLPELKNAIIHAASIKKSSSQFINHCPKIASTIKNLTDKITQQNQEFRHAYFLAVRLLEGDSLALKKINSETQKFIKQQQEHLSKTLNEDCDILLADARYTAIHELVEKVKKTTPINKTLTTFLDRIALNRLLGIPIFLFVMYLMFLFTITIGGAFQDFFEISSNAVFVQSTAHLLTHWGAPNWLITLLAAGLGKGITTTLTFIPIIGSLFLFLSFLENSGYISRAAFVIDRFMSSIGLPGKSFVPMIIGFGCNVPAVMAARTLENKRDRILTIMMTPFMSCGARLAVYAIFTAAFFPKGGQNIVFLLYFIGILMAILTGFVLRKTILSGQKTPLIMEMPPYHLPTIRNLIFPAWHRLKAFIFKAGKIIIPACLLLGALNTINIKSTANVNQIDQLNQQSLPAVIGQKITPIFSPMGIKKTNWPATVGLITGVMAKEVVVATLNTLYAQTGQLKTPKGKTPFSLRNELDKAFLSLSTNFSHLFTLNIYHRLTNPRPHQAHLLNQKIYGQMYQRFDGPIGAFAYLLFVLLYFPCIATVAAIRRELNWGWMMFSAVWTTGIAYCAAVLFYQTATFYRHPINSILWVLGIIIALTATIFGLRHSK